MKTVLSGLTLGLLVLVPALAISLLVLLLTGVFLDLWLIFMAVGLLMYMALRLHQAGHRNPVGRLILFALT